jgi:hypothetical protein
VSFGARDRSIGGDFNCNVVCREHHRDRSYRACLRRIHSSHSQGIPLTLIIGDVSLPELNVKTCPSVNFSDQLPASAAPPLVGRPRVDLVFAYLVVAKAVCAYGHSLFDLISGPTTSYLS